MMTCNKKDVRARQGSNAEKDFSRRGQKNTQERQGCGFWSPFLLAAAVQYDIVIFFGLSVTRNFLENILNFFLSRFLLLGKSALYTLARVHYLVILFLMQLSRQRAGYMAWLSGGCSSTRS